MKKILLKIKICLLVFLSSCPSYSIENSQLMWPIDMSLPGSYLGNLMAQYQDYENGNSPYFHGGCDLVGYANQDIYAPVSGKIEAGYYSYKYQESGYPEKKWYPIDPNNPLGSDFEKFMTGYFEVALIDKNNTRYEIHHIDRKSIPAEINKIINEKGDILGGTFLGKIYKIGMKTLDLPYDHIHYNIIDSQGARINCEDVSQSILDTIKPTIQSVFIRNKAVFREIQQNDVVAPFEEIIIKSFDKKDNNPFFHQPHKISITFESGHFSAWDFSKKLQKNKSLDDVRINNFFIKEFVDSEGKKHTTKGNYNEFDFYNRLTIPAEARGDFLITVEDNSGNKSHFRGLVK